MQGKVHFSAFYIFSYAQLFTFILQHIPQQREESKRLVSHEKGTSKDFFIAISLFLLVIFSRS